MTDGELEAIRARVKDFGTPDNGYACDRAALLADVDRLRARVGRLEAFAREVEADARLPWTYRNQAREALEG